MIDAALPILAAAAADGHGDANLFNPNPIMLGLTWLTFVIAAAILHKVAWKPILTNLEQREKTIKESVANAAIIREEMNKLEAKRTQIIEEAEAAGQALVDKARQTATEVANTVQARAETEASRLLENARGEIRREEERAVLHLRRESADLAVQLARRILEDQLDEKRGRKLTEDLIGKV